MIIADVELFLLCVVFIKSTPLLRRNRMTRSNVYSILFHIFLNIHFKSERNIELIHFYFYILWGKQIKCEGYNKKIIYLFSFNSLFHKLPNKKVKHLYSILLWSINFIIFCSFTNTLISCKWHSKTHANFIKSLYMETCEINISKKGRITQKYLWSSFDKYLWSLKLNFVRPTCELTSKVNIIKDKTNHISKCHLSSDEKAW